jgi:hypothetical protein
VDNTKQLTYEDIKKVEYKLYVLGSLLADKLEEADGEGISLTWAETQVITDSIWESHEHLASFDPVKVIVDHDHIEPVKLKPVNNN